MSIRVVVADDSLLVREGIERMLEATPEIDVVAVVNDRDGLLSAIDRDEPNVVVTGIRMAPGHAMEGVEIANAVRESHPEMGVIVISNYSDPQYAIALLEHGTERRGYLLKDRLDNRERLVLAVREVAVGGSVIDPVVVQRLVDSRSRAEDSPLRLLTPREREVLSEIALGKSNAAIARTLVISKRAVERHIGSIFAKLDLPTDEEASRRVIATLLFLADRDEVRSVN